jgi:uncharacterized protein YlxW (UPF0749 family)
VDLIRREDARARQLRAELDALKADLAALEQGGSGRTRQLDELRRTALSLNPYAGLAAVRGPGLRIVLRDSTLRSSPSGDPNDLVIHEQDLQAVVNALWAAGAEAVAINGERITGTSAIRCVGNTLLLHGSVYSPPYRIAAVGNQDALARGLHEDPLVERFSIAVEEFRLGFDVERVQRLELPAFRGILSGKFAAVSGKA